MGSRVSDDPLKQRAGLSELTGNPAYFFDTKALETSVGAAAGWNHSRLEAALEPRLDQALCQSDLRLSSQEGFYIVFSNPDPRAAQQKADAICADIMRHFFGEGGHTREDLARLCRPSSVQKIAREMEHSAVLLQEAAANESAGNHGSTRRAQGRGAVHSENQQEKLSMQELIDLYQASLASAAATENFLFTPFWDSKQGRISSFSCEQAVLKGAPPIADSASIPDSGEIGIPVASAHCKLDVIALAAAAKGVRQVLDRGDFAAIGVSVHMGTLSWLKSRNGYLEVLSQIDPQIRSLLVPRIIGIDAGCNLSAISQWTSAMRRFVPWTFAHLPNLNFDFWRIGSLGVRGIGFSLGALSATPNGLRALTAEADRLARICSSQRSIAYADNVVSLDELNVLRKCGIRGIAGPAIGQPSEAPGAVKPLSFDRALETAAPVI
jgi:hypothetical protein